MVTLFLFTSSWGQPTEPGGWSSTAGHGQGHVTHTAGVPHSPSTGQWAWGSHWLGTPASHPRQEPAPGSGVHPASREQLEDKEGADGEVRRMGQAGRSRDWLPLGSKKPGVAAQALLPLGPGSTAWEGLVQLLRGWPGHKNAPCLC